MPEKMSISVNGESQIPPGFRFHPTEEELLLYYLRKKVSYEKIDLDVIRHVDLNKLEPWDIKEKCKIGSTPQNDWYLFSHKDKKYPTGTRTNRATRAGFWKATGRDKVIHSNGKRIGMRKTLVFYKGRAPKGQKSDWIMHEYRLDETTTANNILLSNETGDNGQEEGWVVCRVFKKKSNLKSIGSPSTSSSVARESGTSEEGTLEQVLEQMGMNYKEEKLIPSLESEGLFIMEASSGSGGCGDLTNWETLDRLVASQLNDPTMGYCCIHLQSPTFLTSSSPLHLQPSSTATTTTTHTMTATATHNITPTLQNYTTHDIELWNHCGGTCPTLQM